MPHVLRYQEYELDLDALYRRMWAIGVDDRGDGTRLFRPRPGGNEALKWLIADLAGTPVDPVRMMPANNELRRQVHGALVDLGWADRLTQASFRLLVDPVDPLDVDPGGTPSVDDPDDSGAPVEDVNVEALTDDADHLVLAGLPWSTWTPLGEAAKVATKSPGVYVARAEGQIVYVGMAGDRRGQGVRGRLSVYASGRGAVSGLGEAALDRALGDIAWLEERLAELRESGPSRSKLWAAAALARIPIELCWTSAESADQARSWERAALNELSDSELWNRLRPQ
jgi:hypothetical protein